MTTCEFLFAILIAIQSGIIGFLLDERICYEFKIKQYQHYINQLKIKIRVISSFNEK
tara:strand:+ start:2247 stop:2417 length:171 start_codon:yes stop_codon:yes gene_type:complete